MESDNKIAILQSLVDHLKTELSNLNKILIDCGFCDGIVTLQQAAKELLKGS